MTSKLIRGVVYVDLSADGLVDGKPFEALTIGSFIDMSGKPIEITLERLKRIVERTKAALQSKLDSAGEVIGFPIDAKGHENGDAAGWIVGIELAGKIIKLVPRWTELGVEKISKKIQRLFSCTIDIESDIIVGGSLTNWPAVRGLDPVELSSHLFQVKANHAENRKLIELMLLTDESYSEAEARVMRAWADECSETYPAYPMGYPVNVYADYLVVRKYSGDLVKVPYTDMDGAITFADDVKWTPVRMVPVEMPASAEDAALQTAAGEEIEMTIEEVKALLAENNKTMLAQFAALNAKPAPETAAGVAAAGAAGTQATKVDPSVAQLVDLESVRAKLEADMQVVIQGELDAVKSRSASMFAATLAELNEKNRLIEFSRKMTDGSTNARALPVTQARVEEALLSLNRPQREAVEGLLEEIVKSGLVDFSEHGRRGESVKLKALPADVAAYLDSGVKIADLSGSIMKPVLDAAGVTDLSKYDLSKWQAQK